MRPIALRLAALVAGAALVALLLGESHLAGVLVALVVGALGYGIYRRRAARASAEKFFGVGEETQLTETRSPSPSELHARDLTAPRKPSR